MIDEEMIRAAADQILHDTVAAAVYMINDNDNIHFIVAGKKTVALEKLYEISQNISAMLKYKVDVMDMGRFNAADKVRIISHAAFVHSENEFEQKLLETEAFLAYQMHDRERNHIIERKRVSGSFYLQ
ncbi:MAG: hypothetical protein J1F64_09825, partial [Oscillospiraceae bacterium]|nr:hypothetical protein [Oscillospiraceae bacterium]